MAAANLPFFRQGRHIFQPVSVSPAQSLPPKRRREKPAAVRADMARFRAGRKKAGLCHTCMQRSAEEGRVRCGTCREAEEERNEVKRFRGECIRCGGKHDSGLLLCPNCQKERSEKQQREGREAKLACMRAYGPDGRVECSCPGCNESRLDCLVLDHVRNNGAADRRRGVGKGWTLYGRLRKVGFPDRGKWQALCASCNAATTPVRRAPALL